MNGIKGYISIREASYRWGVSERRVNQYCAEGRIPGASRFGRSWAIPENAEKPSDPRFQEQRRDSGSLIISSSGVYFSIVCDTYGVAKNTITSVTIVATSDTMIRTAPLISPVMIHIRKIIPMDISNQFIVSPYFTRRTFSIPFALNTIY